MPKVSVNDHKCHYATYGRGPSVLFMHGGFGGSVTAGVPAEAEPWVKQISENFQLITYDRRSAGQSSAPNVEHTLDLFAADAVALLDHLGIKTATFWGQSAGCAIAITSALNYPERVGALILTDGAPWYTRDPEISRRLTERLRILESEGPAAAYSERRSNGGVGLQMFTAKERAGNADEAAKLERQRREMRSQLARLSTEERTAMYAAELRTQKAYLSFDASRQLRNLKMPTLVIYGTEDRIFPDVPWSDYASEMPNITYRPIVGAAHGCGRSPVAIKSILEFLSQHASATRSDQSGWQ